MLCRSRLSALGICRRHPGLRHASSIAKKTSELLSWDDGGYLLAKELSANKKTQGTRIPASIRDTLHSNHRRHIGRPQIVSPGLCDDILKYMGHTLEQYKGADIIDINPGACMWSEKLHEFLQPRTHILVESTEAFDPYIQRLLDAPGSTYKHVKADITKHTAMDSVMNSGLLPHQKRVQPGDAGAHELNKSLLVTGMLIWEPRLQGIGFDSMAKQLLSQWAARAWTLEGFHAFGPVRSLFWGTGDDIRQVVPRATVAASKYSFFMDMFSKTTTVVSPVHTSRIRGGSSCGREPPYEITSLIRAMRSGKEKGMILPPHRRENIHDFADEIEQMTDGSGQLGAGAMFDYLLEKEKSGISTIGINSEANIEMIGLVKDCEKNPTEYEAVAPEPKTERKTPPRKANSLGQAVRLTAKGRDLGKRKAGMKAIRSVKVLIAEIATIGEEMYNLEVKAMRMKDGPSKHAVLATIAEKEEAIRDITATKVAKYYKSSVPTQIDDRLALLSPVERLQWDSRPYEPLVMQPDEIWPNMPVSLVDFTPRPPMELSDPEWIEWITDFVHGLNLSPGVPVIQALETMQPGASQIVDQAPSLRDTKKGGRLNLQHLRCRMLTVEMVYELCKAYREWPFKSEEANHSRFFRLRMGRSKSA